MGEAKRSIIEIIEEVKEDICDKYCKYPSMYTPDEWEDKIDELCGECPLSRL